MNSIPAEGAAQTPVSSKHDRSTTTSNDILEGGRTAFNQDDVDDAFYSAFILAESIMVDGAVEYCNGKLMERVGNVSVASAIWDDLGETLEKVLFRKVQAQLGKPRFGAAAKRWMRRHPDDVDGLGGDAVD
jgi:hypothetical protein